MANKSEFQFTRSFKAPLQLVWKAFTEAEALSHWWGPKGCKITVKKLDFRPGGIFHYCMQMPDGSSMWGRFIYVDINEPKSMTFIVSFSDEEGNITRHPMAPDWPAEMYNHITFTETNGETTVQLNGHPVNATAEEEQVYLDGHASMQQGYGGTMDQLDEYLASLKIIVH